MSNDPLQLLILKFRNFKYCRYLQHYRDHIGHCDDQTHLKWSRIGMKSRKTWLHDTSQNHADISTAKGCNCRKKKTSVKILKKRNLQTMHIKIQF